MLAGLDVGTGGGVHVTLKGGFCSEVAQGRGEGRDTDTRAHTDTHTHTHRGTHRDVDAKVPPTLFASYPLKEPNG